MRRNLKYMVMALSVLVAMSCTKSIDREIESNELSLLEFRIAGQLGTAVIERNAHEAKATVFIMERPDFKYNAVAVDGIVVSRYARASVEKGQTLNFSNPDRKAKITVTSESGKTLDWWIYIKAYDAFYVGTWRIENVKLHCNQKVAGTGTGEWDTELRGSEFGEYGLPEYDNRITISLDEGIKGNSLTGTIINDAGRDGEYGNFYGVAPPYSKEDYLDMNPRLRHLLPPGESVWELDLTTEKMKITRNNITSEMSFKGLDEWGNHIFNFSLPSAANNPSQNNFYDNMWKSSTDLFYLVKKL